MKNILLLLFLFCSLSAHAQIITTVAGDSLNGYGGDGVPATATSLRNPTGVAIDGAGNIYIADRYDNRIRKVNTTGIITTVAGTGTAGFSGDGGLATLAEFNSPYSVTLDAVGNIYIGDDNNVRIRKVDTAGIITTIAGNGMSGYNGDSIPATSAELNGVGGMAIDKYGNVYVADIYNNRVRKIDSAGIITTVAGNDTCGYNGNGGLATAASLCQPNGVAIDDIGNVYIVEYGGHCNYVLKIDTSKVITTIAGTGAPGYNGDNINADSAKLNQPLGIAVDGSGNIYIGDTNNDRLRKISSNGIISTIAGTGSPDYNGNNISATLANISIVGIATDNSGAVYIADYGNNRIRRVGWPLGTGQLSVPGQEISVYPNPAAAMLTIAAAGTIHDIVIVNLVGQIVYTQHYSAAIAQVDVSSLPSGMYILRVNDIEIKRFIKD